VKFNFKLVPISPSIVRAATAQVLNSQSRYGTKPPNQIAAPAAPTTPDSAGVPQNGTLSTRTVDAKEYCFLDMAGNDVIVRIPAGADLVTESVETLIQKNQLRNAKTENDDARRRKEP
jgi:hypothetical protein